MAESEIAVIGGGLAGAEAAWHGALQGVSVRLFEMRPGTMTPAHRSGLLAELVCSNSLKSEAPGKAHGLLKEEMRLLGSIVLDAAAGARVPAGSALAVDRNVYAEELTRRIEEHPRIEVVREEVKEIPAAGVTVVAAGPLVSPRLAESIARFTGKGHLYFYDAIAPVVLAETIDRAIAFQASRRERGDGDYLNCPLDEEAYEAFVTALLAARTAPLHEGDEAAFFEGCLPVEEIARRGRESLRFGPMRPIGLRDPRTGRRPHAVVQLRQDNLAAEHYSLVGFQTRLTWPEQRRVFRMIPGLGAAEFARYGQIHRNSYLCAPAVLLPTLNTRTREDLFFAGQIAGVEGYTESAATGILAGINAARAAAGRGLLLPPPETLLGALCRYLSGTPAEGFQPVNVTFGLLGPAPGEKGRRRDRRLARSERSRTAMAAWLAAEGLP